ncbi:MAG: substrate-binding domain-containing protein, partial [Brachymonas sp.]
GRHHHPAALEMIASACASGLPVLEMWDWQEKNSERLSQTVASPEVLRVGFDHHRAGEQMANHLQRCGYRDFVFMDSGVLEDFRAHERGQGFAQAIRVAGQPCSVITAPEGDAVLAGRAALAAWHATEVSQGRTHVHCGMAFANDMLAAGAWGLAQELALRCPEQLGLLGFGDFPLARYWGGGLSTLRIDGERIGRECAQLIQSQLEFAPEAAPRTNLQVHVAPELMVRAT